MLIDKLQTRIEKDHPVNADLIEEKNINKEEANTYKMTNSIVIETTYKNSNLLSP